jgi:hypothetical protein
MAPGQRRSGIRPTRGGGTARGGRASVGGKSAAGARGTHCALNATVLVCRLTMLTIQLQSDSQDPHQRRGAIGRERSRSRKSADIRSRQSCCYESFRSSVSYVRALHHRPRTALIDADQRNCIELGRGRRFVPMAESGPYGAAGGNRSLPCQPFSRREPLRHPRQASHHPTEGHPARPAVARCMGSSGLSSLRSFFLMDTIFKSGARMAYATSYALAFQECLEKFWDG